MKLTKCLINFFSGLIGIARLKEFSKNGKAYKWKLKVQDKDGIWTDNGTMRILNLDFWTKPEIKYFQNNLILEDISFLDGEVKIIK